MTTVDARLGEIIDDRYRLVALIGDGASARVYLADAVRLRRAVAVKILRPGLVEDPHFLHQFAQEGEVLAGLRSEHIVVVYDSGDSEMGPYLVTEYLAGGSLAAMLAEGHRLTPPQAVSVGAQAADGLAAAHGAGLVHRDVKPANLLFDDHARLKVADFGVAQALSQSARTEPAGFAPATVRYVAPDRLAAGRSEPRSDVYSLCLTLIEAVTGEVPLVGSGVADTLAMRSGEAVPIPDDFGPARDALRRAGSPTPDERPSAAELADALHRASELATRIAPLPLVGVVPIDARVGEQTDDAALIVDDHDGERAALVRTPGVARPPAPSDPRRRTRWLWRLAGLLVLGGLVAAAAMALASVRDQGQGTTAVGSFVGLPIEDARTFIDDAGWVPAEREVRDESTEIGTVVAQRPAAGTELEAGRTVTVDVVTGRLLVLVPALVGLDERDAVERLEARGFEYAVDHRFDEEVAPNAVIEATVDGEPEPGLTLRERGTLVSLLVSDGPTPRVVPDLVGRTVEQAEGDLDAEQLVLVVAGEDHSETIPAGQILAQQVPPEQTVARDSAIEVIVSRGPDRREVPDLDGRSLDEAVAALEQVGLRSGGVEGSGTTVRFSEPGAGSMLPPDSEVVLFAPGDQPDDDEDEGED